MIDNITASPIFGLVLTGVVYFLSQLVYRKYKIPILNPFLISTVFIIALLLIFDIPLTDYLQGGQWIIAALPVTIILLALPLYRQIALLLEHKFAILAGISAGVFTSITSVLILSKLFGIDEALIKSLVPKSITTPLGLIVSETLGGIASVTVIAIVVTGLMGVIIYIPVFKFLKITHPIAQGIAIGTTSHAIGTSKALELGEVQGAMSSLAIVLAGIITVISAPLLLVIFALFPM